MPLEYEDRPAIGESDGSKFTWRALVIRFVVAVGILATLSAAIFVYILLHHQWLDASRKRAEPVNTGPALRWSSIPDIISIELNARDAITVCSKIGLVGVDAKGETYERGPDATIDAKGNLVDLPVQHPERPVPMPIKIGEGFVFYLNEMGHPGVLDEIEYKLVSIVHGVCVFEMTQRMRERALKTTIIVAPYAADSNQQQAGFPKPPTLGYPGMDTE